MLPGGGRGLQRDKGPSLPPPYSRPEPLTEPVASVNSIAVWTICRRVSTVDTKRIECVVNVTNKPTLGATAPLDLKGLEIGETKVLFSLQPNRRLMLI